MPGYLDADYVIRGPRAIGLALREFRARIGKTQAEVARGASLSRSYLSRLERGVHTEAMANILKTCAELDLEIIVRPRGDGRA